MGTLIYSEPNSLEELEEVISEESSEKSDEESNDIERKKEEK
jgi:hypothetical protein